MSFRSRDGVALAGWRYQPPERRHGTLFLVHGFTEHAFKPWYFEWAARFGGAFGLAAAGVDLRFHGMSGNGIPAFGTPESWDVSALLDAAGAEGMPGPYILLGESLGGLAVQRAAMVDPRIHAAILLHTPSCAWQAVTVALGGGSVRRTIMRTVASLPAASRQRVERMLERGGYYAAGLGSLINQVYRMEGVEDILSDGDIRRSRQSPECRPLLLSVIGSGDEYNAGETLSAWRHWYEDRGEPGLLPSEAPGQRKWFLEIPGASHTPGNMITGREECWHAVEDFLQRVMTGAA